MLLHELRSPKGSRKKRRIVGRGRGSGAGRTAGRGDKGAKSRSHTYKMHGSLEGGQSPLIKRLPKLGFNSKRPILYQIVNVSTLNSFDKGTVITAEVLKKRGYISSLNKPIKILGDGEIKKSLTLKVENISKSAQEKIVKAGGQVEIVGKEVVQQSKA